MWCHSGATAEPEAVAPSKAPEAGLEDALAGLAELDALLAAVEGFGAELGAAVQRLGAAPQTLIGHLDKAVAAGGPSQGLSALLGSLCSRQLTAISARLRGSRSHLEAASRHLDAARARRTLVADALERRQASWPAKALADHRAEALGKRFGPPMTLEEKRARLQAKHAADEAFEKHTVEVKEAAAALVRQKWEALAPALGELCRFYASIFQGSDGLVADFGRLAEALLEQGPEVTGDSGSAVAAIAAAEPGVRPPELPSAPEVVPVPAPSGRSGGSATEGPPEVPFSYLDDDPAMATLLAEMGAQPGSTVPAVASAAGRSTVRSQPSVAGVAADGELTRGYAKGDKVEIWSSSAGAWLEGVVEEVYTEDVEEGGYHVPSGVLRVVHSHGTKYVRPEQVASLLRPLDGRPPPTS